MIRGDIGKYAPPHPFLVWEKDMQADELYTAHRIVVLYRTIIGDLALLKL